MPPPSDVALEMPVGLPVALIMATVALCTILVLLWFVRRRIVQPLRELTIAARLVAGGVHDTTIPVSELQPIRDLAGAVEVMRRCLLTAEQRTQRRTRDLTIVYQTAQAGAQATTVDDLIARVTHILASTLEPTNVGFLFLDDERRNLSLHPSYRCAPPEGCDGHIRLDRGITGTVARTGTPRVVSDLQADSELVIGQADIRSVLCAPVHVGREVAGVLNVESVAPGAFSNADLQLLLAVTRHVGTLLDRLTLYEQAQRQATTDALTGLYNRRYFYRRLAAELERCRRYEHMCTLVMLDVDNFKAYNDRYGHQAGDDLLHDVALIVRNGIRQSDTAVRYGGDEFAVILPETGSSAATALIERLQKIVQTQAFAVGNGQSMRGVTISAGVATFPEDADEVKGLVYTADMNLLAAKEKKDSMMVVAEVDGG